MTTYAATIGAACLVVILTVAATRYLDDRFYVCNDGAVLTREVDAEPLSPIEAVLRRGETADVSGQTFMSNSSSTLGGGGGGAATCIPRDATGWGSSGGAQLPFCNDDRSFAAVCEKPDTCLCTYDEHQGWGRTACAAYIVPRHKPLKWSVVCTDGAIGGRDGRTTIIPCHP